MTSSELLSSCFDLSHDMQCSLDVYNLEYQHYYLSVYIRWDSALSVWGSQCMIILYVLCMTCVVATLRKAPSSQAIPANNSS